jgi:hypothetical protein
LGVGGGGGGRWMCGVRGTVNEKRGVT